MQYLKHQENICRQTIQNNPGANPIKLATPMPKFWRWRI